MLRKGTHLTKSKVDMGGEVDSVRRVSDYLSSYIDLDDYKKYRKEYRKLHEKLLRFDLSLKRRVQINFQV